MLPLLLSLAVADGYPNAALLAEPADLKPDAVVCLDTRSAAGYAAGHVPGARRVDSGEWGTALSANENEAKWAARLGALGIGDKTPVVVYGEALPDAARVWFILRYCGVADVRLLNGGWKAYRASGRPVTTDVPKVEPKSPKLSRRAERLATKAGVLDGLFAPERPQLVDARSDAEFCGTGGAGQRKGAIPGAVHLEWLELVEGPGGRFKNAADIRALLSERGIDPKRPAVTYCQGGGRAAVAAFALELMGGDRVSDYYGSWGEWGADPATPVVRPARPKSVAPDR